MYLMCWMKMFQCEESFDGLKDLIREPFMEVCVLEMLLFLRKRVPNDIDDMVSLVEQYMEVQGLNITPE